LHLQAPIENALIRTFTSKCGPRRSVRFSSAVHFAGGGTGRKACLAASVRPANAI